MPAGRPPFYDNVTDLEAAIEGYWEYIKGEFRYEYPDGSGSLSSEARESLKKKVTIRPPEHPTITGLALYLGFTSRQAIMNYQEKPEFVDAIKRAKLRIEAAYEQSIHGNNPAGAIFALKNFGWKDKQEVEQNTTINGEIKHTIDHSKLSDAALREIAALDKPKEGEN